MKPADRGIACLGGLVAALTLLAPGAVLAQQLFVYDINSVGKSVAIEQSNPDYPGSSVRRGQEGWVRLSFVVTPDGRAIDPIVMNSSGGVGFEEEARKVLEEWRFEPSTDENPWNFVDIRSEINRGADRASSNFMRRSQRILRSLYDEENEMARIHANSTYKMGGWNLYESTMLWMILGRVEGVEEDHAGKLEMYERALAMGNAAALPAEDRITLMEKIFLLQAHFNQLAAATITHQRIERLEGSEEAVERMSERFAEIQGQLAADAPVTAQAMISAPCDCDEGEPLWDYAPARRTFSFANANGNVERFEARCEAGRLQGGTDAGKQWTLAPEWGECRVFVFGDDGATFDFVEHRAAGSDAAPAVARNHVLDRRDRRQ